MAARAYGQIHAAAVGQGAARGRPGGGQGAARGRRRLADLLIAATTLAEQLLLVTRNSKEFEGLEDLITVVRV